MGQDRKYTELERLFALRTVRAYRDRWEQLEKENLESDVEKKIERIDGDKYYKENHEIIDQQELDKIVDQHIHEMQPAEGEAPPTESEKQLTAIRSRFVQVTRGFHAPEQAALHKHRMEKQEKEKLKSGAGDRS